MMLLSGLVCLTGPGGCLAGDCTGLLLPARTEDLAGSVLPAATAVAPPCRTERQEVINVGESVQGSAGNAFRLYAKSLKNTNAQVIAGPPKQEGHTQQHARLKAQ